MPEGPAASRFRGTKLLSRWSLALFLAISAANLCFADSGVSQSQYIRQKQNQSVIVFVHGALGDPRATWTNDQTKTYWPDLMVRDPNFNRFDIYVVSYPSSKLSRDYDVNELVEVMRRDFDSAEIFSRYKRVYFLCHSMGGLVVRAFLVRYRERIPHVPFIYFFSTPTNGAQLSKIAALFSSNPQFNSLKPTDANEYLASVQNDWLAERLDSKIASYCAYETHETGGFLIVGRDSALQLCNRRVDPIDANHFEIVKPADQNAEPYKAFLTALKDNLKDAPNRAHDKGPEPQPEKPFTPVSLSFGCGWGHIPIHIPAGKSIHVIRLLPGILRGNPRIPELGLFEDVSATDEMPLDWPSERDGRWMTSDEIKDTITKTGAMPTGTSSKCEITNYGPATLDSVRLTLLIDTSDRQRHQYVVPFDPLVSDQPFTFYLVDFCSSGVLPMLVQWTDLAVVHVVGEQGERQVDLNFEKKDWPSSLPPIMGGSPFLWNGTNDCQGW
jgi:pimeloyl-ACP methyl ester carboxylesterase